MSAVRDVVDAATSAAEELDVSITSAAKAVCCGAAGCTETEGLLKVVVDGCQRVLCEQHARAWLSEVVA